MTKVNHQTRYNQILKIPTSPVASSKVNTQPPLHNWILFGSLLLLATSVFFIFKLESSFEDLRAERLTTLWGTAIVYIGFLLMAISVTFLLYMAYLFFKYKPIASVSDEELPTCTVVVPAYNEGDLVYHTLISLAANDYPTEKLQIIAIDDGSKDDTWQWIKKAKQHLGERVSIFQQPKNLGKRHALYRGFHLATGDVLVTVDSDSIVKTDTLRNLVSPFVVNPTCSAVAGNVRVLNKKAIIPKMVNVSFVFSFEFIRSAQSAIGSVFCTPGALSAYRKVAVMNCLEDWIHQTFMGQKSDIGEDRAMTNMILKQGYHVLFQRNAYVLTNVPEDYKNLYKMYIRWERSNVRENIAMSKFVFKNFREGSKLGTRIILAYQWMRLSLSYPLTLLMFFFIFTHPLLFLCSALVGILLFSSLQVFFYAKRNKLVDAFWAYPYSLFFTFTLFWITPYAIATVSKNGWLTRTLPVKR
jgi:hyaluronan synthase